MRELDGEKKYQPVEKKGKIKIKKVLVPKSISRDKLIKLLIHKSDIKCRVCGYDLTFIKSVDEIIFYDCIKCKETIKIDIISTDINEHCANCGKRWTYNEWRLAIKRKHKLGILL